MIQRFLLVSITVLFAVQISNAQFRDNKKYKDAVYLMDNKAFEEAKDLFEELLAEDDGDVEVLYNLGYCELSLGNHENSIKHFEKLYSLLPEEEKFGVVSIDAQSFIGMNYQLLLQPEKAIGIYEKVIAEVDSSREDVLSNLRRQIEHCENAIELMAHPVKLDVTNLGSEVNSKYDDHSPLISADESLLLFTSRRASSYSELLPDGQYAERIYYSDNEDGKWDKAKSLKELFRKEGHEAGVCLSVDGTELYIFRNDIGGSNIYKSTYDGEDWSEPVKLPEPINSKFDETHASISPDNNTMYFTSNREGGVGGLDIYRVRRLPNGEWAKPENMSVLNTPYDEETPMIHPDGRTLYFSSEGHNSMGKFDIFYSQLQDDGEWSAPVNIGYPINTPDDDFFFVPTATRNIAYYASSKYEGSYGGSDIYLVEYEEPEINRLAVFKGTVVSGDAPLENVRIYVSDAETKEEVGAYKPHPGTGKYVLILEADKKYKVVYAGEGYEEEEMLVDVEREMAYKKSEKTMMLDDVQMKYLAEQKVVEEDITPVSKMDVSDGIPYYTVQFVSLKEPHKTNELFVKNGLDVNLIKVYECKDGWFRYAYGSYKGYKATLKAKGAIFGDKKIWDDAFIRDIKQYDNLVKDK
nr:tetratricopeptide repeat protein [uncultured Carboxylicivirga sp.]